MMPRVPVICLAAALAPGPCLAAGQELSAKVPVATAPQLEGGAFPPSWVVLEADCPTSRPYRIHEYNRTFMILRQSGCTHYEKPFLYLIFGTEEVLLVDTGAPGADVVPAVEEAMDAAPGPARPLLVVHTHGHGDHVAGTAALRARPGTRVVDPTPSAVAQFFGLTWPTNTARYDLGNRIIDIVPIPGHETAHIAIYDRRTGILLTGDSLYPGRLYISAHQAFRDSIDRLVDFTRSRPVAHVLGGHIEQKRWPFLDYPVGTRFQPEEHVLELGRAHLLELQDALRQMQVLERRWLRDFTVWPF